MRNSTTKHEAFPQTQGSPKTRGRCSIRPPRDPVLVTCGRVKCKHIESHPKKGLFLVDQDSNERQRGTSPLSFRWDGSGRACHVLPRPTSSTTTRVQVGRETGPVRHMDHTCTHGRKRGSLSWEKKRVFGTRRVDGSSDWRPVRSKVFPVEDRLRMVQWYRRLLSGHSLEPCKLFNRSGQFSPPGIIQSNVDWTPTVVSQQSLTPLVKEKEIGKGSDRTKVVRTRRQTERQLVERIRD